jgi:hypothetical protein
MLSCDCEWTFEAIATAASARGTCLAFGQVVRATGFLMPDEPVGTCCIWSELVI